MEGVGITTKVPIRIWNKPHWRAQYEIDFKESAKHTKKNLSEKAKTDPIDLLCSFSAVSDQKSAGMDLF